MLSVHDYFVAEADDEGVEMDDVAFDGVLFFEDFFEFVVAGGFDESDGGEELAIDGLLGEDFGVADLVFFGEVGYGLF